MGAGLAKICSGANLGIPVRTTGRGGLLTVHPQAPLVALKRLIKQVWPDVKRRLSQRAQRDGKIQEIAVCGRFQDGQCANHNQALADGFHPGTAIVHQHRLRPKFEGECDGFRLASAQFYAEVNLGRFQDAGPFWQAGDPLPHRGGSARVPQFGGHRRGGIVTRSNKTGSTSMASESTR